MASGMLRYTYRSNENAPRDGPKGMISSGKRNSNLIALNPELRFQKKSTFSDHLGAPFSLGLQVRRNISGTVHEVVNISTRVRFYKVSVPLTRRGFP